MKMKFVLITVVVWLMSNVAMAMVVDDGGFEDAGDFSGGGYLYVNGAATSWAGSASPQPWIHGSLYYSWSPVTPHGGNNYIEMNSGYLWQTITGAAVGQLYEISLFASTNVPNIRSVWAYIDSVDLGSQTITTGMTESSGGTPGNEWEEITWTFTAATTSFELKFYGHEWAHVDDISITALVVPTSAPASDDILIQPVAGPSGTLRNNFTGNLGTRFRVDQEVSIGKLAFYDDGDDGLAASHTVRIYESNDDGATGAVIAEAAIPAGTGAVLSDGFRWVGLPLPVTLYPQTGTDWYVLAATTANGDGDFWYTQGATGFTYNSYMDTAAGWQACYTTNPGAFPNTDSPATNTTYYAYNMAEADPDTSSDTITNGLVGYWPMDEGAGLTATDISTNSNDGSVSGASWTAGNFGNGLDFNGSSDYVSVPALDLYSNTVTMSAWVKADSAVNNWAGIVFNRTTTSANGISLVGTELRYHWNDSNWDWPSGLYVTVGQWTFVALVVEPDKATLYVNGNSAVKSNTHFTEEFDSETRIGSDNTAGARFIAGDIDEVAIWDRALGQAEVAYLYNSSPIGSIPGVVMTETLGSTEVDEDGGSDSYDIVLYRSPTDDVQITVTPGDSQIDIGAGAGVARVLTFTADPSGDWDIAQTVTVTAADDAVYEGSDDPHTTVITHTSQSLDVDYDDIAINSVAVAVYDNELICGDWGYLEADVDRNCYVDILDFIALVDKWMYSL